VETKDAPHLPQAIAPSGTVAPQYGHIGIQINILFQTNLRYSQTTFQQPSGNI
jgi:hypothetical protein